MAPLKKSKVPISIKAACIGGIFVVIAAIIAAVNLIYVTYIPIHVAQTAEAKFTELALISTSTPISTPTLPTTPTVPSPVNTVSSTPAPAFVLKSTLTPAPSFESSHTPAASPTFTPTPVPVTSIPIKTLLVACRDNVFGGASATISSDCTDPKGKAGLLLAWLIPDKDSYAGCTISLDSLSSLASGNNDLILWVRGNYDNEQIEIKLKNASNEVSKPIMLSNDWQQRILPLSVDFQDINMQALKMLTIGISYDPTDHSRNGNGSACFSDIGFGSR